MAERFLEREGITVGEVPPEIEPVPSLAGDPTSPVG
jgi:hypothetical protein